MFKLEDIVELAKAGYKPEEVKELIKLSKEGEAEENEELPDPKDDSQKGSENVQNETEATNDEKTEAPEDPSKVVDYKKKVEELESKIAALQAANTRKNMADTDEKSDSETFADVMRSFM